MFAKVVIKPFQVLESIFPILRWSRKYDVATGVGDLIAGITVALTLIPQSIAYASLAGLEPQYGLYASFAGGFVYAIMGSCPQINIGPTALLSLITFTYIKGNPDLAVLLCLFTGIVQLFAGIAQLGFLVDFVSLPVVSGFTSAAALTIASSQIKGLLGLKFSAESFTNTWKGVFNHIDETRMSDSLLSFGCCVVLIGMKAMKDIKIKEPEDEKNRGRIKIIQKCMWFLGVARNAVVVVIAAAVAYFIHESKEIPFILTGKITPGLPVPRVPAFSTVIGNTTYSSGDMFSQLGSGLLVVPLVGIIANVAIAKAFSNGKTLDATQEIIALGVSNAVGAFFQSFPINGSFTRSAVSDASGVRTPAAGFYTGIIVILTLALLTPYFYFIPRAALSSVIICAVLHMVDLQIVQSLWKTNKLDLIPLIGAFVFCLALGIEIGLICGVGVDILLLLYYHSRPPLDIQLVDDGNLPPHYTIQPIGGLHFPGAERVRAKLTSLRNPSKVVLKTKINCERTNGVERNGDATIVPGGVVTVTMPRTPNVLVICCDSLERIDYTFLQSIKLIAQDWSRDGCVIWLGVRKPIRDKLSVAIENPTFCDTIEDLRAILSGNSDELHSASNTRL